MVGRNETRAKSNGFRQTEYGPDHACTELFLPLTGESGCRRVGRGVYTFGTPVLYIAEKPDLPGNKNFFLDPLSLSFSLSLSPLLFQPPHFPLILQRFLNTPSFFLFPPPSRIYSCLFLLLFFFLNSALYTLYSYFILSVLGNEPALRSSAVRYNRVNAS